MSYTFSRRAFFKYSAAAAVAVAGASLLSGCKSGDPFNPVAKAVGTSIAMDNIRVIGTLNSAENGVFSFTLESERDNPIRIDPQNFAVNVVGGEDGKTSLYFSTNEGGVKLSGLTKGQLDAGETVTFTITAPNFPTTLEVGDTVNFMYYPIYTSQYGNYSMTWQLEKTADTTDTDDSTTTE